MGKRKHGIYDMPHGWTCKNEINKRIYQCWNDMIKRCCDEKTQEKTPTYKDCYVCDKWLKLSGFVEDVKLIDNFEYWANNPNKRIALDKDIKSNGVNKCYCLEQCMFVDQKINSEEGNRRNRPKKAVKITKLDINEVFMFDSATKASKELNISQGNVSSACRRGGGKVSGYYCTYVS